MNGRILSGCFLVVASVLCGTSLAAAPKPHFKADGEVVALLFSPDGRWLAVHGQYTPATYFTQLWGMKGEAAGERAQVAGGGAPFAFSADGALFASTHRGPAMSITREGEASPRPTVIVYDVTGRMNTKPRHVLNPRAAPQALFFVEETLIGVDRDGKARLWNVASGLLEKTEEWGTPHVAFHAGRNRLVLAGPTSLVLRNAATRAPLGERPLERAGSIEGVRFSPDGGTLAIESRSDTVRRQPVLTLYDVATLAPTLRLENTLFAGWLSDGRFVTRGGDDRAVLRSASGAPEHTLGASVGSLYASPDRRLLLDVSGGVVTFRDSATWTARAYWLPVAVANTAQPLIATPGGLFDGDSGTWKSLAWQFDTDPSDLAPAELFAGDWFRPGLLAEVVEGRVPARKGLSGLDRRPPQLELGLAGTQPMFSSRSIKLAIHVVQAPAGSQDLRLFRNGVLVKRWHGAIAAGTRLSTTVAVLPGKNLFSAYAFNRDSVKSPDATFRYDAVFPAMRESATIVAFGVNRYRDPRMRLRYAAPDAEAFAAQLKRALERTGHWDEVRAVTLLDDRVTRASILGAIGRLTGKDTGPVDSALKPIERAQPSDTVFLFFAGHGVTLGERFYLVPHEVPAEKARVPATAVSDAALEAALEPLDAREIVLIVDSCYSGQMLEGEEARQGPLNARGLAQLAYEKGMYVLVAAQARQQALEASRLGHGLLTHALVREGLGTAAAEADTDPRDGVVRLIEWLQRAPGRVPELQADLVAGIARGVEIESGASTQQAQAWTPQRPRLNYRRGLEPMGPPIVDLRGNR